MKSLNKIFEISNNKDLNDLNYSTNCFGLCKYDTSALYSRGIKTSNNDVLNRYEDYSATNFMLWHTIVILRKKQNTLMNVLLQYFLFLILFYRCL